MSHPQIRASREEIAKSLEGNWRPELLFVLKQEVEMYDIYQRRIAECDWELEAHLKRFADNVHQKPAEDGPVSEEQKDKKAPTKLPRSGKRAQGNAPCFDLRSELYRIPDPAVGAGDRIGQQDPGTLCAPNARLGGILRILFRCCCRPWLMAHALPVLATVQRTGFCWDKPKSAVGWIVAIDRSLTSM